MRTQKAFTLIELLIVISIVTVLAGLLMVVGGRVRTTAKISASRAALQAVKTAISQYAEAFGRQPSARRFGPCPEVPPVRDPTWNDWMWQYQLSMWQADNLAPYLGFFPKPRSFVQTDAGGTLGVLVHVGGEEVFMSEETVSIIYCLMTLQKGGFLSADFPYVKPLFEDDNGDGKRGGGETVIWGDEDDDDMKDESERYCYRVVDSWGQTVRLELSSMARAKEEIQVTSPGPDGEFDTEDDILGK